MVIDTSQNCQVKCDNRVAAFRCRKYERIISCLCNSWQEDGIRISEWQVIRADGQIVLHMCRIIYRQVQRHKAVAARRIGQVPDRRGSACRVGNTVYPRVAVAGVNRGDARGAVADGQVQGHEAVAARGVGQVPSRRGGACRVGDTVYPRVAVASVDRGDARGAVADCQVQRYEAVAARGVGQVPGRRGGACRVGHTVDPCVAVAGVNHGDARGAVAYRQVQRHKAVASRRIGQVPDRRARA